MAALLMTTRTVLVLATSCVNKGQVFLSLLCAMPQESFNILEMLKRLCVCLCMFDCFQTQQHYTRSLNVKLLVTTGVRDENATGYL